MDTQETIKSWRWRIIKAGYNLTGFADDMGINRGNFSDYLNGNTVPKANRFNDIENKLKELGV